MRGKVVFNITVNMIHRITPAYAGKSRRSSRNERQCEDHPRLCGEKQLSIDTNVIRLGSPPPMRGKGQEKHVDRFQKRITPAYAGKSLIRKTLMTISLDHPRLCGEK